MQILGFLSNLLLILMMCTLRLIFAIHGCIIQLVRKERGRKLWRDSHRVAYDTSHFQTSFSWASLLWIEAITSWNMMSRREEAVVCCNAGRKPSQILILFKEDMDTTQSWRIWVRKSVPFCIWFEVCRRILFPYCSLHGLMLLSPSGTKSLKSIGKDIKKRSKVWSITKIINNTYT